MKFLRLLRRINPTRLFRKKRLTEDQKQHQSLHDLRPLIIKLGHALSTRSGRVKNEIHDVLNNIENQFTFINQEKESTELERVANLSSFSDPGLIEETPKSVTIDDMGQTVKLLLNKINLAEFTGIKVANQLSTLVDKGLELKNQYSNSIHQKFSEYLEEELEGFATQNDLDDFINHLDELSLNIKRLQTQVHQLMSGHEIN